MFKDKSLITNFLSLTIIALGFFIQNQILLNIGFFSFSGAITNWLAVHMLFDKVPFLYGSGVIIRRFEDFKVGIKNLILDEFFNNNNIEKFLSEKSFLTDFEKKIKNEIDFDQIFKGLVDAIKESSLGGMLALAGGEKALEPLREPVIQKLEKMIGELMDGIKKHDKTNDFPHKVRGEIEHILGLRLAELTPEMVKEIIQKMIRKHLGWLVVWGGVFGGVIGLVFAFV